ncbi:MAG: hypothetical protein AAF740_03430 [Bacteroidota bacterium]
MTYFEITLFERLRDFFAAAGYGFLLEQKQYRQRTRTGFRNVILSMTDYEGELIVEVNLGIRKDHVEEIVQQFLTTRNDFQSEANTIIISIGKLTNNPYFRYKVINDEDLELCQEQICHFMSTQGFDFLNEVDNLMRLDTALNKSPRKPSKYMYNQRHRCFKGLVVAYLNKNPNYEQLTHIYREVLQAQGSSDMILLNYQRMVDLLANYSVN